MVDLGRDDRHDGVSWWSLVGLSVHLLHFRRVRSEDGEVDGGSSIDDAGATCQAYRPFGASIGAIMAPPAPKHTNG